MKSAAARFSSVPEPIKIYDTMADLPHIPSTPAQLFERCEWLLEKLKRNVEDLHTAPSVSLQTYIVRKPYGAKVCIAWMVPSVEYCHCEYPGTCSERAHIQYAVRDGDYRIKSDFTLKAFEHGVRSDFQFCLNFTQSEPRGSGPFFDI